MSKSIFNPENQNNNLSAKIIAGLERISEAFKVLLWEKAKTLGLSPIQIQILIFIAYHKLDQCNVSHLAKEFNVTKPTISDAVRVLIKKELIEKVISSSDSRSYAIQLSPTGKNMVMDTENFAEPLEHQLHQIDNKLLEDTFAVLSQLIHKLNRTGLLSVQRTCFSCKFYSNKGNSSYCNLLESPLSNADIRLDCPEFQGV
ncbi:MarR family winged helix-turn-helix transcriptional regulator [Seonamhaeicola marinus]|uniref:MarR family transcriptional regulator n=1 Tax=Seonamhaeicola marinus TaxID=1912246 RepID=A0A5D0HIW1_9FLAO|nr:helix-turn-helix domain-containing protein [Seonamhaeicola marinus]TYA69997.1 MarR family transcriptional regulator [Seonamhaeicola marinus]